MPGDRDEDIAGPEWNKVADTNAPESHAQQAALRCLA